MNSLNKVIYHLCNLKNRYPCKIIKIILPQNNKGDTLVTFKIATRLNIRELSLKAILDDPFLIDKFRPSDAVKLGFLSAKEILISSGNSIEDVNNKFLEITDKLFSQ